MNTLHVFESAEPKLTTWLGRVALGLLGLVLLVSLVLSFVVEFMATGADHHRHAQTLLETSAASAALGGDPGDQPSRRAH